MLTKRYFGDFLSHLFCNLELYDQAEFFIVAKICSGILLNR